MMTITHADMMYQQKPWNKPYAIVNDGRALSYGQNPLKPELTLYNHPPPPYNTRFDYTPPVMGQPMSDALLCKK